MSGIQLLAEMKSYGDLQAIPLILITNEGAHAKRLGAIHSRAAGYITKPFTATQVQEQLTAVLARTSWWPSPPDKLSMLS